MRDDGRRARIMAAVTGQDTSADAGELLVRLCQFTVEEMALSGCALVLIGYMAFITFYDVQDSGRMAFGSSGEIKFAPKNLSAP